MKPCISTLPTAIFICEFMIIKQKFIFQFNFVMPIFNFQKADEIGQQHQIIRIKHTGFLIFKFSKPCTAFWLTTLDALCAFIPTRHANQLRTKTYISLAAPKTLSLFSPHPRREGRVRSETPDTRSTSQLSPYLNIQVRLWLRLKRSSANNMRERRRLLIWIIPAAYKWCLPFGGTSAAKLPCAQLSVHSFTWRRCLSIDTCVFFLAKPACLISINILFCTKASLKSFIIIIFLFYEENN